MAKIWLDGPLFTLQERRSRIYQQQVNWHIYKNTLLKYLTALKYVIYFNSALGGNTFLSNKNNDGDTPLHLLARSSHCMGVIKLLLEQGAKLSVKNKLVSNIYF